ncbi:MAG TPA: hypothetical protein VI320_35400 [Terracidiphilus sp.]
MVRPTQFPTQCVENWEGQKKPSHMPQVRRVKAFTEICYQGGSESWRQTFAIFGPRSSILLEFYNVPSDLPAGLYLNNIHSA